MKKITIKDVAKEANVSYSTVSRALADSDEISESTKKRILAISEKMGYHVNAFAKSLVSHRSGVIGVIVPNITSPFYSELSLYIEEEAQKAGYNILLSNSCHYENDIRKLFRFHIEHQVDGIIYSSPRNDAVSLVREQVAFVPTLLVGDSFEATDTLGIHTVGCDNFTGGYLAADCLLKSGHKNIIYLGYREASITHKHRFDGFKKAVEGCDVKLSVTYNTESSSNAEVGYTLAIKALKDQKNATAVFAATDSIALGTMRAADELGMSIPGDISLIGYDNITTSSLPRIMLTTVDQCKKKMAKAALSSILGLIKSESENGSTRILVTPELIMRNTL